MSETDFAVILPIIIVLVGLVFGSILAFGKSKARQQTVIKAKPRDYAIAGLIILGVIAVGMENRSIEAVDKKEMLRAQFAIPADVELVHFEHQAPRAKSYREVFTRGLYRFTDAQLDAYKAKLDDPAVWLPQPLSHAYYDLAGQHTYEARQWQRFPRPLRAADMNGKAHIRELPWLYHVWWDQDWENIKNGRIMCFLFEEIDKGQRSMLGRYNGRYQASACSQRAKQNRAAAVIVGILDYDRKTLFVKID